MSNWACSGAINEQGSAQARAMLESKQYQARADLALQQTWKSDEYDHNDQDGSFLNDDYCDRLDNENHD